MAQGPYGFLLSGITGANTASATMNCRASLNYAYWMYVSTSPSAAMSLQVSHDETGWMTIATVTATPTTGTAQISGYYPYVRGLLNSAFGGGGATATSYMFYAPGAQT